MQWCKCFGRNSLGGVLNNDVSARDFGLAPYDDGNANRSPQARIGLSGMQGREIARAPSTAYEALTAFNLPVFESHAEISALIAANLGSSAAEIFSRPERHGAEIRWVTGLPGAVRSWSKLGADERHALEPARLALADNFRRLAATLGRAGINTKSGNMSHLLQTALIVPGPEHMHLVGDRIVLSFWGFRQPGSQGLAPFGDAPPAAAAAPPVRRKVSWLPALCLLLCVLGVPERLQQEMSLPTSVPKPVQPKHDDQPTPSKPEAPAPKMVPPPVPVTTPVPTPPAKPVKTSPVLPKPKPKPAPAPRDNVLRMPVDGDLSKLEGCWRTDNYSYGTSGSSESSTYCFDGHGHGHMVHEGGGAPCEAPADIELQAGGAMYLADRDSVCRDGTTWHQDRLFCKGAPGGTASCQGQANGAGGALLHWSTTLRRR